jgi:hypothetical protein
VVYSFMLFGCAILAYILIETDNLE